MIFDAAQTDPHKRASTWPRPSSTSQLNTRIAIRSSRRKPQNAILAQLSHPTKPQVKGDVSSSEAGQIDIVLMGRCR